VKGLATGPQRTENRDLPATAREIREKKENTEMKKLGFATIIASGLIAGVVGITAPSAQAAVSPVSSTTISAGIDHHTWLDQIGPSVNVPKVDTSVHQSR
jgi:hypothetical protein